VKFPIPFKSPAARQALPGAPSRTPSFSPIAFGLISAVVLVALYNWRFWSEALGVVRPGSASDAVFLTSVFVVLVAAHASLLLLIPGIRLLKAVVAFCAIAGAVGAYFANSYGVGIDADMIRNTIQTDAREAADLMNVRFVLYAVLLGVVPAVLLTRLRVAGSGWKSQLGRRGIFIAACAAVCIASVAPMGAQYASFLREHKPLRYLITPANIVYGGIVHLARGGASAAPTQIADLESPVSRTRGAAGPRPLVMFLVIGETARAANFQLGGYARPTNPELASRGVDYFSNAWSCGTSTAVSLPCMFSGLGRKDFDVAGASRGTNMLDALTKAGVAVEWRDNNSGCKGICARVASTDYRAKAGSAALCNADGCYDEVMLEDLPAALAKVASDTLIVFHQAGSHGPAYSLRYPKRFEAFKPVCYGNELSRCTRDEVVNAYDNSVLYTDFVVARQIDLLQAAAASVDGVLLYVSDHGESLGEKGLYLHGAPYVIAPDVQKHVPLLLWMSADYRKRFGISADCVNASKQREVGHDNLYHTVLGAMGVKSARYQPQLDMLAACRTPQDGVVGDLVGLK
jgi:lipid A ethanolaminephosphotransferase